MEEEECIEIVGGVVVGMDQVGYGCGVEYFGVSS